MKIKLVSGYCLFGVCILLASVRDYVLVMEHIVAVDVGYYIGLISGILVMVAFIFLGGCEKRE